MSFNDHSVGVSGVRTFLPSAWRGLGVFANYTHLRSREVTKTLQMVPNSASAGFSYTNRRFYWQLKANWVDDALLQVQSTGERRFLGSRLFSNGRNLNNQPLVRYSEERMRTIRHGEYGVQ